MKSNLRSKTVARSVTLFTMALIIVVNFSSSSRAAMVFDERGTKSSQILAYDRSAPFDLKETSTREQDGAVIKDVNYAAYASRHGRINAFLVKPKGAGPFAGIVFFHWLGKPKGGPNPIP